MTFRTQEVFEGIQTDMRKEDVARLFTACLARLAADGREMFEAMQKEALTLDASDQGEAASWLEDLFPEDV